MKIVCSLGALLAWITIAFLLGLAIGAQLVSELAPAPSQELVSCCNTDEP
jgi:hypothetical protein